MNLLFLSQCLPYPPHSGVTNRTFNILRQLRKEFDVTLFAFSRRNHQADADARERASEALAACGVEVSCVVPVRSASALGRAWVHARSVATKRPYTTYEYSSSTFDERLQKWLEGNKPDLVHIDSLDLYRWVEHVRGLPVTCTHHSIESELLRLRADRIGPRPLSAYIRYQGDLVEHVERRLCPAFDLNVMMSELDGERLRKLAPGSRTVAVPNGVDVDFMRTLGSDRVDGRVVFLGPTYMFPNKEAIEFFLAESWDRVRTSYPRATLNLVGRIAPSDRQRYEAIPGVSAVGYVPDVRPSIDSAQCCIAPLRVGGGTRLKILDYWAMGKAVVSTALGCEGLEAVDGENILIRDDPEEFAEAVANVLADRSLRARLQENARATAEHVYGWDKIGEGIRSAYGELLHSNPRSERRSIPTSS